MKIQLVNKYIFNITFDFNIHGITTINYKQCFLYKKKSYDTFLWSFNPLEHCRYYMSQKHNFYYTYVFVKLKLKYKLFLYFLNRLKQQKFKFIF